MAGHSSRNPGFLNASSVDGIRVSLGLGSLVAIVLRGDCTSWSVNEKGQAGRELD